MKKTTLPSSFLQGHAAKLLAEHLQANSYGSVHILVDENTKKHCLSLLKGNYPVILIKSGEANKSIKTCEKIWSALEFQGASRHSLLVNLGGGLLCDLGGFAASVYMRGMAFIHIPTTLIAQGDSCLGGKTGINFLNYKNHLGAFAEPACVILDTAFFASLPKRELISGYAELLKHGLIAKRSLWKLLEQATLKIEPDLIQKSLACKLAIVRKDPHEKGLRKLLNFGHTVGHAIESAYLKKGQPILHGEAVAAGIICESYLSYFHGGLSKKAFEAICEKIERFIPLPEVPQTMHRSLLTLMRKDKKNKDKRINFSLLNGIGKASIDHYLDEEAIVASLNFYSSR